MAKLLYVTCDLRPGVHSCCLMAGQAFLDEYVKLHPRDDVQMLDLYRDPIQTADPDVLCALEKTVRGHHFATLTTTEQRKLGRIRSLSEQFAAAEKYLLVTPMWKPGFPAELWEYLDAVLVAGKTYRNTPHGPEGLLQGQGRKCLLIHASEGFVYGEKEPHCVVNIRNTLKFLGIEEFNSIVIKGANPDLHENRALIRQEIQRVTEAVLGF
jgi:FMN-dependent NADH-azoreductase